MKILGKIIKGFMDSLTILMIPVAATFLVLGVDGMEIWFRNYEPALVEGSLEIISLSDINVWAQSVYYFTNFAFLSISVIYWFIRAANRNVKK